MPLHKATFARLTAVSAAQYDNLARRLLTINFELGEGYKVLAVDKERPRLNVQVVVRTLREQTRFNEAENKMVTEPGAQDREAWFSCDLDGGIAETPGGRRDFAILLELLRKAGASREVEAQPLAVDLLPWVKQIARMYETAQLANVVYDGYFVEPRLLGRYSAKSVDNRLNIEELERVPATLRSLRLGFFHDGCRRTVEARTDGVLSITSSDEEDAEHFFNEQRRLLLEFAEALVVEMADR